jgi:hypothetical protein
MSTQHVEFSELTPEADAAMRAGAGATADIIASFGYRERRSYAAFLREAMKRSESRYGLPPWDNLAAIADNLHNPPPPPPPPPTLAQAREAARQLGGEDAAIVHAFLATLEEARQP